MKLVCKISVRNRLLPSLGINSAKGHIRSTLALCKNPKSDEYCLILFTDQNKLGTRYLLKGNVSQVFTKFVNDGKATIQIKNPPHDLCMQADVIQLKSFLHLLKRALQNKISPKEMTYSSMSVTPVAAKDIAPTKLHITTRAHYPVRGFPRTLEVLSIMDINRQSLDLGILKLNRLKVLNLSKNCIKMLPEDINKLPNLSVLDLSFNEFGNSAPSQWYWLGGNLSKSLQLLNLSNNNLKYLPDQIAKLHKLVSLNVQYNQLTKLPAGIGNLRHLRDMDASNNLITELPGSVKKWRLQTLNISNNNFDSGCQCVPSPDSLKSLPVCSLKEDASRRTLNLRLEYNSEIVPKTLVDYLDCAKYCVCGRACFEVFIHQLRMLQLSSVSQTVNSDEYSCYVPINCYFCSAKCFKSTFYNRSRNPVI